MRVFHANDGLIVAFASENVGMDGLSYIDVDDDVIAENAVTQTSHYVSGGMLVAYTEAERNRFETQQPSLMHMWSVATKQWYDPRSLSDQKAAKWEQIKASRKQAIEAGFVYLGNTYQSDPTSLSNISGAVTSAIVSLLGGQSFSVQWTTADNAVITLSRSEVIALGVAASTHVAAQYARGVDRRNAINAATTSEQLDEIEW